MTVVLVLLGMSATGEPAPSGSGAPAGSLALPLFFVENAGAGAFLLRSPRLSAEFQPGATWLASPEGRLRIEYVGAAAKGRLQGDEKLEATANFLSGSDPARWRRGMATYARIVRRDLYLGVDLVHLARAGLKSEFHVRPEANPAAIRMAYRGAERIRIGPRGELRIGVPGGEWREDPPVAWQETADGRRPVAVSYVIHDDRTVGFRLAPYDTAGELVIDPEIDFSSFFGGSGNDNITGVAVDPSGGLYIAGFTDSPDLSLMNPILTRAGSTDAFVAKFNHSTKQLIYCTYLGGSADDRALAIAVDAAGTPAITGTTTSRNFPLFSPIQSFLRGTRDAFVVKLNAAGNGMVFSTYYGGTGSEFGHAVAIDPNFAVYVAGETTSGDFPVVAAYQGAYAGQTDAFLIRFSPGGAPVVYATYLGGSGEDRALGVAVNAERAPFVAGGTTSLNFPRVNPAQPQFGGQQDGFLTKFRPAGNSLQYSTTLGGAAGGMGLPEQATAVAVDSFGSAYVTGTTPSPNFPLSSANKAILSGPLDAFVTKFSPPGSALPYSTYLGGSSFDYATGIGVDPTGSAYVSGYTSSWDFPQSRAVQGGFRGVFDSFLAKLNPSGVGFAYSTLLGGFASDAANAVAVDAIGQAFVAGQTHSSDFPVAAAVQPTSPGGSSGFLSKITDLQACTYSLFPSSSNVGPNATRLWYALTTAANCNWTAVVNVNWLTVENPVGTGPASIFMRTQQNTTGAARTATITVGGSQATLTQGR
ncbi:MAG: SBBP repeat-containing protein [Bryobacteraceae bacterium]|nr:SBBP repeat-containing protein [Bryobacteraceae bacterium]